MGNWTPGPWEIGALGNQKVEINTGPEPRLSYSGWDGMAKVYGSDDDPATGSVVMMANARLISAAPELLEAMEMVRGYIATMKGAGHEYTVAINAAIAKATGAAP